MFRTKLVLIIFFNLSLYSLFGQDFVNEIDLNLGVPLYSEKYFSEKSFSYDNNQLCHDGVRKSGYFSKGGLFYSAGYQFGFELKNVKYKIGASTSVLQQNEKAIADSALKYADCNDPFILENSKRYIFSVPIGISYTVKKLEFGVDYFIPIYTLLRVSSAQVSGIERNDKRSFKFYKSGYFDKPYQYFQLNTLYSLTTSLKFGLSFAFNNARQINHLNFNLKVSL